MNALKASKLIFRKTEVERVTVVKLRMDKRCGNGRRSFMIKTGADTTKITNVKKTTFGQGRDLVREVKMLVHDEPKITCRYRWSNGNARRR